MSDSWFVMPDTVRVPILEEEESLPEGQWSFWLEVKRELTWGERNRLNNAALQNMQFDATTGVRTLGVDFSAFDRESVLTWVTDWNLRDHNGKSMPFNRNNLGNLKPEYGDAIKAAVDRHKERVELGKPLLALTTETVLETTHKRT